MRSVIWSPSSPSSITSSGLGQLPLVLEPGMRRMRWKTFRCVKIQHTDLEEA